MAETYCVCEKCRRLNRVHLDDKKEPICGACKATLPLHGALVEGHDGTLATLIEKSPLPVVIDVWAPWCGPCRAFAPTFEELSSKFAGKVVFVKLNSDENQQSAARFGIRSIPTLIVFKNGAEVSRQMGAMPREQFGAWLEQITQ